MYNGFSKNFKIKALFPPTLLVYPPLPIEKKRAIGWLLIWLTNHLSFPKRDEIVRYSVAPPPSGNPPIFQKNDGIVVCRVVFHQTLTFKNRRLLFIKCLFTKNQTLKTLFSFKNSLTYNFLCFSKNILSSILIIDFLGVSYQ